jgi:thioredoxin reductase (NADPH)
MGPLFGKKEEKEMVEEAVDTPEQEEWFLPEDSRDYLGQLFTDMQNPIHLEVFIKEGENDAYNDAMLGFTRDLDRLAADITVTRHAVGDETAQKYKVDRSPTLLINPEEYNIRYTGTPLGEEARTFIETVMSISKKQSLLSAQSKALLDELDEPRNIKVFVDPDCPYCPGQVSHAFQAAIYKPEFIHAECIETRENRDLAEKYQAQSLPLTIVEEELRMLGLQPEERFIIEAVTLKNADEFLAEKESAEAQAPAEQKVEEVDLLIIGGGPAGLTSAIYARRAGLTTLVIEKGIVGGQLALTPEVENYPGFKKVAGAKLVELIAGQAMEYGPVKEGEHAEEVKIGKNIEVISDRGAYKSKSLIFASGASPKKLGVPGEREYFGRGVSVCASCDGWQYKNKSVIMVGGGNSALTEALHLKNIGVDITVIHRRDTFRAQQHLVDTVEREGLKVLFNTVVLEFIGTGEGVLSAVKLMDVKEGKRWEMEVEGAFLAIGWEPNSGLAAEIGVKTDDYGYIVVDEGMRTNIPRIYAAGDITGGVQQIVTAVGKGSVAAISVFEDIANPYWKRKRIESQADARS